MKPPRTPTTAEVDRSAALHTCEAFRRADYGQQGPDFNLNAEASLMRFSPAYLHITPCLLQVLSTLSSVVAADCEPVLKMHCWSWEYSKAVQSALWLHAATQKACCFTSKAGINWARPLYDFLVRQPVYLGGRPVHHAPPHPAPQTDTTSVGQINNVTDLYVYV